MMFKKGDKVILLKDEEIDKELYSRISYSKWFRDLIPSARGKVLTILEVDFYNKHYPLEENYVIKLSHNGKQVEPFPWTWPGTLKKLYG